MTKITETDEHKTVASYFRKVGLGPGAMAIHIRNETGSAWERMIGKQMGVVAGVPDWLILHEGDAGGIELKPRGWKATKRRTGNYTEHEKRQLATHARMRECGCWVEICETLEEVLGVLRKRGVKLRIESITAERLRRGFEKAAE